jgi:hypothetical protein
MVVTVYFIHFSLTLVLACVLMLYFFLKEVKLKK